MTHLTRAALAAAAVFTFLLPPCAEAQRRASTDCAPCVQSGARLGFLFESQWERNANDNWREIITVREVLADTPASGRLQRGDEILRVNGLIATSQLFWSLRRTVAAGDTVQLRIRRGNTERDVTLTAREETPRSGAQKARVQCL